MHVAFSLVFCMFLVFSFFSSGGMAFLTHVWLAFMICCFGMVGSKLAWSDKSAALLVAFLAGLSTLLLNWMCIDFMGYSGLVPMISEYFPPARGVAVGLLALIYLSQVPRESWRWAGISTLACYLFSQTGQQ